jgi:hypothetical protein
MSAIENGPIVSSDGWTGGVNPPETPNKFDIWSKAHPVKFMTAGVVLIALLGTARLAGAHGGVSAVTAIEAFLLQAVFWGAIYGSQFGGFYLYAKLISKIKLPVDRLSRGMMVYLFVLFLIGLAIAFRIGPFLVTKLLEHAPRLA